MVNLSFLIERDTEIAGRPILQMINYRSDWIFRVGQLHRLAELMKRPDPPAPGKHLTGHKHE